jgi:hypothetical protein
MNAHDEWSKDERAALRALPRGEPVTRTLADSTVAALHARGLLRRRTPSRALWPLAAAAALALFLGGYAFGQMRGIRAGHELAIDAMTAVPGADAARLAVVVQRTGTAYLRALDVLARNGSDGAQQAQEAALVITEAALREVTAFAPDTLTRARLARRLQSATPPSIWY